jgi:hypothetical protein
VLYKAADLLLKYEEAIEDHLLQTEEHLFGLDEKITLYDLGIASEENIKWRRSKSYRYIVVFRKMKKAIRSSVSMIAVKRNGEGHVLVQAGLYNIPGTDEFSYTAIRSTRKEKKKASRTGSGAGMNPT